MFPFRQKKRDAPAPPEPSLRAPVVYTMGKVASSSVVDAIKRVGRPVYHIHSLRNDRLQKLAHLRLDRGEFPDPWVCEAMAWKERLFLRTDRCFYISLVREPIGRNVSGYFQNLESVAGPDALSKSAEELLAIFIEKYPHHYAHRWFDREFQEQLGVDVYRQRFDASARYVRLSAAPILIFRVDCDDATKSREISKALGFTVEVTRYHDSAAKAYADKYAEFKRIARFPAEFLDHAYGTKYSRHFWSEAELASYRKAWSQQQ